MSTPLSEEEIDRQARKRANAKLGWYLHLGIYVVVNLFIFAMSQHAFGTRPWSLGPLLGWGLGLVLHGLSVFVLGSGSNLRDRMEEREREALRRRQ